jgi:hypothetical protein
MKSCHACGKELSVGRTIGRKDVCPHCGVDVRCCLNCAFYDRAAAKSCREPAVELISDKARANFCDYFSLAKRAAITGAVPAQENTRKALDDLFKKN